MAMTEAFINPEMVRWARERSYPTVEAAVAALGEKKLPAWEQGNSRPTFKQAQRLASRLHIPFGYLFLEKPPPETIPLQDFRTVGHRPAGPPSREFIDVVNDAYIKQQWYREYQESEGTEPLAFIGMYRIDAPVERVADSIDEFFGVRELARTTTHRNVFIRQLTRNIEGRGVLVMRSRFAVLNQTRRLNVEEFRGFAITDNLAPLIFINAEDALGAQIFTFVHELAHLFLGESGVSNPNYRRRVGTQGNDVEDLCDEITAETLMPRVDFLAYWQDDRSVNANLAAVTVRYRASNLAAMRRARDLDKISDDVYWDYFRQYANGAAQAASDSGTFYPTFFVRNSRLLASTIILAVSDGRLPYREAAGLLNVRVQTLNGVARELFGAGLGT